MACETTFYLGGHISAITDRQNDPVVATCSDGEGSHLFIDIADSFSRPARCGRNGLPDFAGGRPASVARATVRAIKPVAPGVEPYERCVCHPRPTARLLREKHFGRSSGSSPFWVISSRPAALRKSC